MRLSLAKPACDGALAAGTGERTAEGVVDLATSFSEEKGSNSAVAVQRLSGEGEMGLTQGFVLRRMGVDVRRHITRVRFPAVDQLRFTDQFADSRADHVHAHHWTAGSANELDEACGLEDPRFPVTSEVVGQRLDLPVGCSGSFLGQADGRDLDRNTTHAECHCP